MAFESKKEKYIFAGITIALFLLGSIAMFYPAVMAYLDNKMIGNKITEQRDGLGLESSKSPEEYYQMFQCSCCGQAIDADCCGMAKQRKDYLDKLLLGGLDEDEIVYNMVKKFGFDVLMDSSMEQEVTDYIKSQAPDDPPEITIEDPKYDFGTISQADGKLSTTFTIKNTGGSELVIENMDSSCMCTTASITYKGEEGPIFGMSMHGENPENYKLTILSGGTATLNVYYDPMAHGKQDKPEVKITREVTIISNDPVDFQKKVRIELTQTP